MLYPVQHESCRAIRHIRCWIPAVNCISVDFGMKKEWFLSPDDCFQSLWINSLLQNEPALYSLSRWDHRLPSFWAEQRSGKADETPASTAKKQCKGSTTDMVPLASDSLRYVHQHNQHVFGFFTYLSSWPTITLSRELKRHSPSWPSLHSLASISCEGRSIWGSTKLKANSKLFARAPCL